MVTEKHIHTDLPLTAAVEEGPYYKTGSPERRNIAEPDTLGIKLIIEGHVLDKGSQPVPHAWLDFWQADGNGGYDNDGFNLRGHQYADHEGFYHLETVKPGGYEIRAAHVHVKVRATKNTPILTTQLFFPGDDMSDSDPIFDEETVMDVGDFKGGLKANFDFVVDTEQV